MTCERIILPGGQAAIVCSSTKRCKCGRPETRLCDWKVPGKKSGACDASICDRCATSPAPGKDLCLKHAVAFEKWQQRKASAGDRG